MAVGVSNTSPLLYLYRIGVIEWLPQLFGEVWIPEAVEQELETGQHLGYSVPIPGRYAWLQKAEPQLIPVQWLGLGLGAGELAAMSLAMENAADIVLLDDQLARRIAQAAGLQVWGTLKVLLESKRRGFTNSLTPLIDRLQQSGMWLSADIRRRVLVLADENID